MSYATDGKCHNSQRGTFGHECGKPATWVGTRTATGFRSGFCDWCREHGDERHGYTFERRGTGRDARALAAFLATKKG